MTAPARVQCSAAGFYRDRHMVVGDRRWILKDPAGAETIVCSLACVVTVACRWLLADLEAGAQNSEETAEAAA